MGSITVLGIPHSLGSSLNFKPLRDQLTEAAQEVVGKKSRIIAHVVPEFDSSYDKGDDIVITILVSGLNNELTQNYGVAGDFERALSSAMRKWVKSASFPEGIHVKGRVILPSLDYQES